MSILRKPEVKAETGWRSDASVSKAVRDGFLTKPVHLGPRSVGWPSEEVQAINAARIAGKSVADIKALVNRLHAKREQLVLELV